VGARTAGVTRRSLQQHRLPRPSVTGGSTAGCVAKERSECQVRPNASGSATCCASDPLTGICWSHRRVLTLGEPTVAGKVANIDSLGVLDAIYTGVRENPFAAN